MLTQDLAVDLRRSSTSRPHKAGTSWSSKLLSHPASLSKQTSTTIRVSRRSPPPAADEYAPAQQLLQTDEAVAPAMDPACEQLRHRTEPYELGCAKEPSARPGHGRLRAHRPMTASQSPHSYPHQQNAYSVKLQAHQSSSSRLLPHTARMYRSSQPLPHPSHLSTVAAAHTRPWHPHRGAATVQTEQNNPFGLYRFDEFE